MRYACNVLTACRYSAGTCFSRYPGLLVLRCLGRGVCGGCTPEMPPCLRTRRCRVRSTMRVLTSLYFKFENREDLPNTCSGYQSAFVRFLVCSKSSMARLCSFCFSPRSRTTSQLSPFTGKECTSVHALYQLYARRSLPLIHRQVTQSSRGFSKKSLSVSLLSSYFSILSREKSTAVIWDFTFGRH